MNKLNLIKILELSVFLLMVFSIDSFAQLADSAWPMSGQNLQHTARSAYGNPASNIVKWKYKASGKINTSPVIGPGEIIYLVSSDDYLYAINPEGTLKWKIQVEKISKFAPAIGIDGTIYVVSDSCLVAINPDSTYKWTYTTLDICVSLIIGPDGTIYVVCSNSLYAINNDGTLKWEIEDLRCNGYPVIGTDGTLYCVYGDGICAVNPDGTLKWDYNKDMFAGSSPAIGPDGTIYFKESHGGWFYPDSFYAFNPKGSLKWVKRDYTLITTSPVIGIDGTIYFFVEGYEGRNVYAYALNPNGTNKWVIENIRGGYNAMPAIGADGTIYISSGYTYLSAINPDGTMKWQYISSGDSFNSPLAIGSDGTLYAGTDEGYLYAFLASKIKVTSPNGGEVFLPGDESNITWTTPDEANIKIEYSADDGKTWNTITDSYAASKKSYRWTVPDKKSTKYRIKISDIADPFNFDISDEAFAVTENIPSLADSAWPMRGQNPQHTGRGKAIRSTSGEVKWRYQAPGSIISSPAIGPDGAVYFGSEKSFITLNADGTLRKKYSDNSYGSIRTSPAIDSNVSLYFGTYMINYSAYLHSINTDTQYRWKYPMYTSDKYVYTPESSPTIGSDGIIYIESAPDIDNNPAYLYAITFYGTLKWRYKTNGGHSSPAIGLDGTIYVGSSSPHVLYNYIYAFNSDGTLKWRYETERYAPDSSSKGYVNSSPAIDDEGTVYAGSNDSYIYAINSDGSMKWRYKTEGKVESSPAIGIDSTIYIGSDDGYIYAIKSDGSLKWRYKTEGEVNSSPAIGMDGTIYIGSDDHFVYAIKSDGALKWNYQTGGPVESSPAIAEDGTLYIGSNDGYLYAFAPETDISVENETPASFKVNTPSPNPFNPKTTISFYVPKSARVTLEVYSISGQKVATLFEGNLEQGNHEAVFDGSGLASGVYLYRFESGGFRKSGKMLLMK